jgi:hypothetical protein
LYHHDFTVVLINEKEISSAWLDRQAGASIWARKKMKFLEKWLEVLCLFLWPSIHMVVLWEFGTPSPIEFVHQKFLWRINYCSIFVSILYSSVIKYILHVTKYLNQLALNSTVESHTFFICEVKSMHRKPPRTSKQNLNIGGSCI